MAFHATHILFEGMETPFANLTLPFLAIRTQSLGFFMSFSHIMTFYSPHFAYLSHSNLILCGPFGIVLLILDDMSDLEASEAVEIGNLADFPSLGWLISLLLAG